MTVAAFYKDGTITVTNGDATVTGTGTTWTAAIKAGDELIIADSGLVFEVASVTSDTSLELAVTYPGTTASGKAYRVRRSFAGAYAAEASRKFQDTLNNGTLAAYANANPAADQLVYGTGAGTASTTTFTPQARALLDDASAVDMRATLGTLSGTQIEKNAAYTILSEDQGKTIIHTATTATSFSFEAAASLGSTFFVLVKNEGTGQLTLDPNGAETIDGNATIALDQNQAALVFCDGTLLRTLFVSADATGALIAANNLSDVADASTSLGNLGGMAKSANLSDVADASTSLGNLGGMAKSANLSDVADASTSLDNLGGVGKIQTTVFTAAGTYTKPTKLLYATVELVGGGGGGSGSLANTAGGSSGWAGGYARKTILATSLGATETVTIGAGGAGGAAGANDGVAGGTTSFGSHVSATGGGKGVYNSIISAPGVGSGGDVNISGGAGSTTRGTSVMGQQGGASYFGGGGWGGGNGSAGGGAGMAYGSGGGSALVYTSDAAGGAGRAGIVIITEYMSS